MTSKRLYIMDGPNYSLLKKILNRRKRSWEKKVLPKKPSRQEVISTRDLRAIYTAYRYFVFDEEDEIVDFGLALKAAWFLLTYFTGDRAFECIKVIKCRHWVFFEHQ